MASGLAPEERHSDASLVTRPLARARRAVDDSPRWMLVRREGVTLWLVGSAVVAEQIDLGALLVYTGATFQAFKLGEVWDYDLQV